MGHISDASEGTTHSQRHFLGAVLHQPYLLVVYFHWKPHLEELICRTVVDGGRRCVRWLIVAPLELAETVDAVEVAGVQLGEVDVREVSVQAIRTHLLLPILKMEKEKKREGKVMLVKH